MVLLQARSPKIPSVLTVIEDTHVLLFGKDGVVGLQAVLLEHLLIASVCQPPFLEHLLIRNVHTRSLFNVIRQW
jgi:hypothetical protein